MRQENKIENYGIGFHVSISGGLHKSVERALDRGCTAFQIFCGNPRGWALRQRSRAEIEKFQQALDSNNILPPIVHACYLINPCSTDAELSRLTQERLTAEMIETARCGAKYYVIHPGSSKGADLDEGIRQAAQTIAVAAVKSAETIDRMPVVLLENTAGDYGPGANLQHLAELRDAIIGINNSVNVGFAIDTCHAHTAGYDLNREDTLNMLEDELHSNLGHDNVHLIHANDSASPAGSGTDRHEHIGKGSIGLAGFRNFFSIKGLNTQPVILETPWENAQVDRANLDCIKSVLKRGKIY